MPDRAAGLQTVSALVLAPMHLHILHTSTLTSALLASSNPELALKFVQGLATL